jgi:hypothetical protein
MLSASFHFLVMLHIGHQDPQFIYDSLLDGGQAILRCGLSMSHREIGLTCASVAGLKILVESLGTECKPCAYGARCRGPWVGH